MAGNDPPSPYLTAAFCQSEIPRQARDDRGKRVVAFRLICYWETLSLQKGKQIDDGKPFLGAHLPISVMAGNDPPSPYLTAAFCQSEIPRQARDDRGKRVVAFRLICYWETLSLQKGKQIDDGKPFLGAHLPISVMAGNDPPSPYLTAAFCQSEIPRQARDDRSRSEATFRLICYW